MKLLKYISTGLNLVAILVSLAGFSLPASAGEYEDRMRYENMITELNNLHPEMSRVSAQTMREFPTTFGRALNDLGYFLKDYKGEQKSEYVRGLAEKLAETLNWGTRERGRDSLTSNIDVLQEDLIDRNQNKEAFRKNFSAAFKFIIRASKETAIEMVLDIKSLVTAKMFANARRQKMLKQTAEQLNSFIAGLDRIENGDLKEAAVNILGQSSSDVEILLGNRGEGSKLSPFAWVILGLASMQHVPIDVVGLIEPTYVSALMSATVMFLIPSIMFAVYKARYGVHKAWEKFIDVRWGFVDVMEAMEGRASEDSMENAVLRCKASVNAGN